MRVERADKKAGHRVLRLVALAMLVVTSASLSATRAGNFCYRGNPELLNGRVIDVSDTMVALSSLFWAEIRRDTTVIISESPSIFLVIDNSGSMQTSPGNDSSGIRFTIASAYIDSVQAKFPGAEVGLAVFGSYLYFDPNDRPCFTVCGAQANGAYVPLLKLDSVYSAYSNQTGYQILKSLLAVSTYDTGADQYVGLTYQPTDTVLRGKGCNLTAGFDAVKSAMASATASRCSQYVVLFSDGEANAPGGDTTWYFRDSVINVPTTFSVFFPVGTVPAGLQTMTTNIRVNGYDTSTTPDSGCTTRSAYFSCNAADLMGTLSDQIWDINQTPNATLPSVITVNGFLSTQRAGDSCFVFNNYIPLTGQITPVNVATVYSVYKNNVHIRDTTISSSYNVRTMPNTNPTWSPSQADSFQVWTWDRDFGFRYNNTPIQFIADTMDSVQLYFTFDSGTAHYGYDNVYIDLYNKIAPIDHQQIQLSRVSDNVFSGKFKRQVSATANVDELPAILQYRGANDSVVAVFRNREQLTTGKVQLPLDTLRKTVGFVNVAMNIAVNDTTITGGDTTGPIKVSATVGGTPVDSNWVMDSVRYTLLPATARTGDMVLRTGNQWARFTGLLLDTINARYIVVTLPLPNGVQLSDTMQVRVKYLPANRLWIEADNTPDSYQPNPFGTMTLTSPMMLGTAWAILRDRFNNLVGFSTSTTWISRDTAVATVTNGNQATGEGIVVRGTSGGTTWIIARNDSDTALQDSFMVVVSIIGYDQLRIMRYIGGTLTRTYQLYDTMPKTATLYVQAHRTDGLGGNGGWVDVAGTWSLSATLTGRTSSLPPSSSNSWSFTPIEFRPRQRLIRCCLLPERRRTSSLSIRKQARRT
jgi:hypothetical protein